MGKEKRIDNTRNLKYSIELYENRLYPIIDGNGYVGLGIPNLCLSSQLLILIFCF